LEFDISIIRDISDVMSYFGDDATVHVVDDNIMVSHEYRGHSIVTWFKGDGVMHIYEADYADIETLEELECALYNTHWSRRGGRTYLKVLQAFIGE